MSNSGNVLQFTQVLCQFLYANVSLSNSLKLVSEMKNIYRPVRKAAFELTKKLEEGTSFSTAINQCESIKFPDSYSSFLEIAQETGNILETMKFLEETEIEKNTNRNEFITISLYPLFVTILSFALSILLYKYSSLFSMSSAADKSVLIKAAVFLLTSAFSFFLILKKVFDDRKMINLLHALSFLVSSGTDIKTSLEISISIAQEKNSMEKKILCAIDELERGKKMSEAFSFLSKRNKYIFEVENTCGNMARSLKNLLLMENQCRVEKMRRVKNLCEPVMIVIVSIYILILAKGLVLPLLFDYSNFM